MSKKSAKGFLLWLMAAAISMIFTALIFFPAAWIAPVLEAQTAGRLTLGDAQGTLWHGSAFIGGAPSGVDAITPLLPGRFSWRLSPTILLGYIEAEVNNPSALSQPVTLTGSWHRVQISPAALSLPAERLAGLGAPLNTIQPSGQMQLSWQVLELMPQTGKIAVNGMINVQMDNIASRLSPVKPLGAYHLIMDWRGQEANLNLTTRKGPMLLSGTGTLANGHLRFSGKAEAEAGQEEPLANLLNLLGQRHQQGNRSFIALVLG